MADADDCRRRAEALLTEAAHTVNMRLRSRLIDEAMHWHNLALEADGHRTDRLGDAPDDAGADADL
jgi:hypothetical protein